MATLGTQMVYKAGFQGDCWGGCSLSHTNSAGKLRKLRGTFSYDQERKYSHLPGTQGFPAPLHNQYACTLTEWGGKSGDRGDIENEAPCKMNAAKSAESLNEHV